MTGHDEVPQGSGAEPRPVNDPASWSIAAPAETAPDKDGTGVRGFVRSWGAPVGVLFGYLVGALSLAAKEPGSLNRAALLEIPVWFVALAAVHVTGVLIRSVWANVQRKQQGAEAPVPGFPSAQTEFGDRVSAASVLRVGASSLGVVEVDGAASGGRARAPLAVILINALLPATLAGAAIGTDFGNRLWSYTGTPDLALIEEFTAIAPVPPGGRLVDTFDAEQPDQSANTRRHLLYEVDEEWTATQIADWLTSDAWGELPGYGRVVVADCHIIVDTVCTGLWTATAQNPVSPRLRVSADGPELRVTFEVDTSAAARLPAVEALAEVWELPVPPGYTLVQVLGSSASMVPAGCAGADLTYAPTVPDPTQFDTDAQQDSVYGPQLSAQAVDAFADELVSRGFDEQGDRLSEASGTDLTSLYLVKPGSTSTSGTAVNVFSYTDTPADDTTDTTTPDTGSDAQPVQRTDRQVSVDVVVC